jgi:hypothetical protein
VIATIAWLDRLMQKASDSEDADLNRLADSLRLWRAGAPLETAMGLQGGWRGYLDQRTQQAALAALVAAQPAGLSCLALAIRIAEPLLRYETTAWPRDRDAGRRPPGLDGLLYDLLLTDCPRSVSRLRRVLKELGIIG